MLHRTKDAMNLGTPDGWTSPEFPESKPTRAAHREGGGVIDAPAHSSRDGELDGQHGLHSDGADVAHQHAELERELERSFGDGVGPRGHGPAPAASGLATVHVEVPLQESTRAYLTPRALGRTELGRFGVWTSARAAGEGVAGSHVRAGDLNVVTVTIALRGRCEVASPGTAMIDSVCGVDAVAAGVRAGSVETWPERSAWTDRASVRANADAQAPAFVWVECPLGSTEPAPARAMSVVLDRQAFVLAYEAFTRAEGGEGDAAEAVLAVQQRVLELLGTSLRVLTPAAHVRRDTTQEHARLAEVCKACIARQLGERLLVGDIAEQAGTSAFHLCRVFRAQTGLSLHQYLTRLRLQTAYDRLTDRAGELATLATHVGFASHSHFCDAFKREFGVTPTTVIAARKTVR